MRFPLTGSALLMLVTMAPAHGYIDPGTGSMVLQLLGAGVAGALFYFRSWRSWLADWLFGRKRSRRPPTDQEEAGRS
jgi:hypothetical protein